jgi:ATP-dependent protease ClpP protease subunit
VKIPIKGTIIPNDYKDIYDWFGYESTSPNDVEAALEKANGESIEVEINSGGGEIFAGSEIYSKIKAYAGNKIIEIVGLAGSAASVIAMAAKSRIYPAAMMMIHNVASTASGDFNAHNHEAEILLEANKAIANAYEAKTGKTQDELLELMNAETWMNAKTALENGFVDEMADGILMNGFGCRILTEAEIREARAEIENENKRKIERERLSLKKMEVI